MMKSLAALQIVVVVGLVVLYGLFYGQQQDIVYVDSVKLLNEYKGMVEARAAYQKKAGTWQANIDTLTAELQASI
jgi:outer membrane protein